MRDDLKAPRSNEAVRRVGARFHRLPPYSPDLYAAIADALDHVTPRDVAGWFRLVELYAFAE